LWAFKSNTSGGLLDAVSLGQKSYTTIATNAYPLTNEREQITTNFSDPAPALVDVLSISAIRTLGYGYPKTGMLLGDFYGPVFKAPVPASLDPDLLALMQPSAVVAQMGKWSARYPSSYPQIGQEAYRIAINSDFQYAPTIFQQTDASSNPTIHWVAARQRDANVLTINTLELTRAGIVGWKSHWTIHTPAGEQEVILPNVPVGISEAALPQAYYNLMLSTRVVEGLDYQGLVGAGDVHQIDAALATEIIHSSDISHSSPHLQR